LIFFINYYIIIIIIIIAIFILAIIYVIDIIRDLLISTDSTLKNLEVKGQKIDFASDKTEYKVHITHDIDKLDLVVEPEHEKATYLVTGNKDLENGSIVKVKVTA